MALNIIYQYKSKFFSYSIRESFYKGKNLFFINVLVCYPGLHKHIAEKNSLWGSAKEKYAKNRIKKTFKEWCVGTDAENLMKLLPIFQEEGGYQETLFNEEDF